MTESELINGVYVTDFTKDLAIEEYNLGITPYEVTITEPYNGEHHNLEHNLIKKANDAAIYGFETEEERKKRLEIDDVEETTPTPEKNEDGTVNLDVTVGGGETNSGTAEDGGGLDW